MLTNETLASAKAAAMKCVELGITGYHSDFLSMRELLYVMTPALIVELIDGYTDALDRLGQAQRLIEAMRKGKA